jgi:hypothetical protein
VDQPRRAKQGTATAVRTFLAQCSADISGYGSGSTMEGESMADKTVKKVEATSSPSGEMGQRCLASGKAGLNAPEGGRAAGRRKAGNASRLRDSWVCDWRPAELHVERQLIKLSPGDSWLVPAGAEHRDRILEPFTAVEATAPPAQVHARDSL